MKLHYLTRPETRPARKPVFDGPIFKRRGAKSSSSDRRPERQAKTLSDRQVERLLEHVQTHSKSRVSDELKVLLSFYAGLRVGEIATLPVSALCDAEGKIGPTIIIYANNAKNGQARRIPMHPRIHDAAARFRREYPDAQFVAISSRSRMQNQSPNTLACWFLQIYRSVGFEGCSSHSGRRTFITNLARAANQYGNSLRDVQRLAGHARLDTTQRYIDPSEDMTALVASLGNSPSTTNQPHGAPDNQQKGN